MSHTKIFKNTVYQIITKIVTSGVGLIMTILIASHFGVLGYGDFTKITAFVGLFYLISDFGLNAIFLQKEGKDFHFSNLLYLRLLLALLLVFCVNIIVFFLPFNKELNLGFSMSVRLGIMIFSLSLINQAILFSTNAIFQKKLRFDFLMKSGIAGSVITLLLTIVLIYYSYPLYYVLLALVLGGSATSILALYFAKEKIIPYYLDLSFLKNLIAESFPIGLMLVFNLVYFRADIFLLSIFKPTADVGIYGLSYKFFDFLIALPLFLSNSIYPTLLSSGKNYRTFFNFVKTYLFVFLFLSIIILILFWFLAPLIALVKSDFIYSVLPFRILILSLPLFFLTSLLQWVLISQKKKKFLMYVYLFSAVLNVVFNLIFIPNFSYIASAIITGISEGVVFIFLLLKVLALQKNMQNRI